VSNAVIKKRQAERDLDEQSFYIAQRNPDAGFCFLIAAEAAFENLAKMPELGTACRFREARLAVLRFWPISGFENFLVFCRPNESGVEIVRILHGAQDVHSVLKRME